MSETKQTKSDDLGIIIRSTIVYGLIIVTGATLLVFLGLGAIALTIGYLMIAGLIIYSIFRYMRSLRGYQDRYTQSGKMAAKQGHIFSLVILGIVVIFTYTQLNAFIGNTAVAFGITGAIYIPLVQFIDRWSAKNMEEYVAYKQMRHDQFVRSLGDGAGKCMSCQTKLEPEEQFCSNCGFERRQPKPDTSYAGKQ